MPKLQNFDVKLKTGKQGIQQTPRFAINSFVLDFEQTSGGTGPGETLEATGAPDSFPHSLVLLGPDEGEWDIDALEVTYNCAGEPPYRVRFAGVSLDSESDLSIWQPRPEPAFDV